MQGDEELKRLARRDEHVALRAAALKRRGAMQEALSLLQRADA